MNKKIIFCAISAVLPNKLRNIVLNKFLGWELNLSARISRLAIINVKKVKMGFGSKIGAMTYAKGLDCIILGDYSSIGRLNWITGFPSDDASHFSQVRERLPALIVGNHSSITNRHLIDCTDCVEIGEFSTFAGFRSQILTHSIDLNASIQSCKPVYIGNYSFVGTGVILLGGASLPNRSILAAGSVLSKKFEEENCLYGGGPARKIKFVENILYFDRKVGSVK